MPAKVDRGRVTVAGPSGGELSNASWIGSTCLDGRIEPGKPGVEGGRCVEGRFVDGGANRGVAWKRWLLANAGPALPGVFCDRGGRFVRRNFRGVGVCKSARLAVDTQNLAGWGDELMVAVASLSGQPKGPRRSRREALTVQRSAFISARVW